ncbi:MAG: diguanylate cyclase, partial [Methylophilaceae bacterium]|nr:diguanylate cyclase [Methylophilaceae bacterium]
RQKTSVSLFVIKVNELASLNLANGQNSGDYALQKLAKCLSLLFRRATDLIFRTDEDQFMILTTQMDKTQSDFYVNQIKLRIKNLKIMNRKTNEQLTANVGCAFVVPKANMKSDVIIKDALKQLD